MRDTRLRLSTALIGVCAVVAALLVTVSANATLSGTTFEGNDGNLAAATGNFDWNSFATTTWTGGSIKTSGKTVDGWQFAGITDLEASTQDSAFAGGVKQDNECASVGVGKAPNKGDLKRVYLASKTETNGHTYLSLAWTRITQNTTSPSAHVGFEFNQGSTACGPGTGGLVERTEDDMLIVYNFEGGSADTPTLLLSRWTDSGSCEVASNEAPCWGIAETLTAAEAEARVNTSVVGTVTDAIAPNPPETLGLNEFGEATIDLTEAGVFDVGECATFGKAYAVSRSSGSSATAQMKDLVGPTNFSITNCGQIKIIKRTDPRGEDQAFAFTSNLQTDESAAAPSQDCTDDTPSAFSLNDNGNSTSDSAGNTLTCVNVPAGNYTVTESADPANFDFNDASCTATGTGTSGAQDSIIEKRVNITLVGGGSVTCVFVNDKLTGAIEVTKTKKHAAATDGTAAHSGVTFTVKQGTTVVASNPTGTDGKVCFDGLPFDDYTVTETVPTGYDVDANPKNVTVDNSATCSDDPYGGETVSFVNTPRTDLTVTVNSQIDGGTASTIDCGTDDPDDPADTDADGDGELELLDLPPGTYTCEVVIDP